MTKREKQEQHFNDEYIGLGSFIRHGKITRQLRFHVVRPDSTICYTGPRDQCQMFLKHPDAKGYLMVPAIGDKRHLTIEPNPKAR